jgi:hypothetical protein
MKILIGGSMAFAREQVKVKAYLESRGFDVLVAKDIEHYARKTKEDFSFDEEVTHCIETDVIRDYFDKIADCDAYLVLNHRRRNIEGYLGTSVLMELGLAYYLKKKIFLLYPLDISQPYAVEVSVFNPTTLNGDISNLNKELK